MGRRLSASNTEVDLRGPLPRGEVTTTSTDPEALQLALEFAGGDRKRLSVSEDGRTITVRNNPTRQ